jgi:DNA-binding response OmpR family regulator
MVMAKKILVADDDPAILDAIRMILEMEEYDVSTSVDGETIYKMENEYPDLLLLDIWMSGEDGRDICRFLKSNPKTKNIPVILISASRDIMKSAKEAGADDFLAKPFEMDDLLNKVAKFTGQAN